MSSNSVFCHCKLAARTNPVVRKERGHTLVELIGVMVIISVLSYIGIARIGGTSENIKERSFAKKVVNDLGYAQEMAVSFRRLVKVIVEPGGNRYSLRWEDLSYLPTPVAETDFIVYGDDGHYSGVSITATGLSDGTLEFNSAGEPLNNGSIMEEVLTALQINGALDIKITPGTGVCYVEE